MESRVWEMLYFILREILEEERDMYNDEEDIRNTLLAEGYNEDEIELAFNWLENYFNTLSPTAAAQGDPKLVSPPRSLRVLTFDEKMSIAPEAHGFLMSLESKGLIAPEIKEEILNRSMNMFDESIGLEEMRLVALLTIFEQGQHNLIDLVKMVDGGNLKSFH